MAVAVWSPGAAPAGGMQQAPAMPMGGAYPSSGPLAQRGSHLGHSLGLCGSLDFDPVGDFFQGASNTTVGMKQTIKNRSGHFQERNLQMKTNHHGQVVESKGETATGAFVHGSQQATAERRMHYINPEAGVVRNVHHRVAGGQHVRSTFEANARTGEERETEQVHGLEAGNDDVARFNAMWAQQLSSGAHPTAPVRSLQDYGMQLAASPHAGWQATLAASASRTQQQQPMQALPSPQPQQAGNPQLALPSQPQGQTASARLALPSTPQAMAAATSQMALPQANSNQPQIVTYQDTGTSAGQTLHPSRVIQSAQPAATVESVQNVPIPLPSSTTVPMPAAATSQQLPSLPATRVVTSVVAPAAPASAAPATAAVCAAPPIMAASPAGAPVVAGRRPSVLQASAVSATAPVQAAPMSSLVAPAAPASVAASPMPAAQRGTSIHILPQ